MRKIFKQMSTNFILYKPCGVLSQLSSNDPKEQQKKFLGELYNFPQGIMPVGRLDKKSEGLLLMTTEGKLSDLINRSGIEKEYYAQLDGNITVQACDKLRKGIEIGLSGGAYRTKPCEVQVIESEPALPLPDPALRIGRHRPTSWISITIKEGKYRQVRKMTAAVGFPTLRLVRVRIGNLKLASMNPGEVQKLNALDIQALHVND
jgi:23S rRNA pseudouridine2457 synthase